MFIYLFIFFPFPDKKQQLPNHRVSSKLWSLTSQVWNFAEYMYRAEHWSSIDCTSCRWPGFEHLKFSFSVCLFNCFFNMTFSVLKYHVCILGCSWCHWLWIYEHCFMKNVTAFISLWWKLHVCENLVLSYIKHLLFLMRNVINLVGLSSHIMVPSEM